MRCPLWRPVCSPRDRRSRRARSRRLGGVDVLSPRPSLEPVAALFAAKQFDEAAARLTEYLRVYPPTNPRITWAHSLPSIAPSPARPTPAAPSCTSTRSGPEPGIKRPWS